MATARPVDRQRNYQPPYMPHHESAYLPTQHPGGQLILSPSTTTGVSSHAPKMPAGQFIRQSGTQQHYNRGGVVSQGYDYYTVDLTGRGGASGEPISPGYQFPAPLINTYPSERPAFSTGSPTHPADVSALPLPPPTSDDPNNIPRGQEQ